MSEGSVFRRKDGKWCAKYKDALGTCKYIYRKTKGEARQALREALKERDEGATPVGNQTVEALLYEWLYSLQGTVSHRTWVNRECTMRVHLKPTIGTKKVAQLTPDDIRGLYRSKLTEGLAPSYVKRLHIILKQALPPKYISNVKPPKVPSKEMEVLTKEQVLHLLETVRGDRFEAVYTARIWVAIDLRWEDLDLDRGTLKVQRTLWNGQTTQPKTATSRRTLTLPERALDVLVRLRSSSDGQGTSLLPEAANQRQRLISISCPGADVYVKRGCPRR